MLPTNSNGSRDYPEGLTGSSSPTLLAVLQTTIGVGYRISKARIANSSRDPNILAENPKMEKKL